MTKTVRHKDLRAEQVKLVRFEKTLETACRNFVAGKPLDKAPVLAGLAAVSAAAASAAVKLEDASPLALAGEIERAASAAAGDGAWLANLAEVVTRSHNAVESMAIEKAFQILAVGGGTPKKTSAETVLSLLTSGPF